MKKLFLSVAILLAVVTPSFAEMQSSVTTDSFEHMTIHTYQSNDPMGDVSFVIESKKKLVILEPQAFAPNIDELLAYVKTLNKPVEKIFVAFHPAGLKSYPEGEKVITKPLETFIHSDAGKGMLTHFKEVFKGQMDVEVVPFDSIISQNNELEVDGITYTFYPTSLPGMPGVNIDINSKVLYQHFAPTAHSHPSPFHINSLQAIEGALSDAIKAQANGYPLFLGSHYPGKGKMVDLKFQITYLKKMKTIANESTGKSEFIEKMKSSYPELDGEKNIEEIAGNIFKS